MEALAGVRSNGVRVVVEPVTYSRGDVARAQRELESWLRGTGRRGARSSSYACADGSGLVVGMVPPLADCGELQAEIAEAVGVPVRVVPEQRPVLLGGR